MTTLADLVKTAHEAAQLDRANAFEVGFAKAAHDAGLDEAAYNEMRRIGIQLLQQKTAADGEIAAQPATNAHGEADTAVQQEKRETSFKKVRPSAKGQEKAARVYDAGISAKLTPEQQARFDASAPRPTSVQGAAKSPPVGMSGYDSGISAALSPEQKARLVDSLARPATRGVRGAAKAPPVGMSGYDSGISAALSPEQQANLEASLLQRPTNVRGLSRGAPQFQLNRLPPDVAAMLARGTRRAM